MKKISKYLLPALLLLAIPAMSGCESKKPDPTPIDDKCSITLDRKLETIEYYDSFRLSATVEGIDSYSITWKSSDESIVTVDETGLVKGYHKVGKSVISATVKDAVATCDVYVTESATLPYISLDSTEIAINKNIPYVIYPKMFWKSEEITSEGVIEARASENNIVQITSEDNVFTLTGLQSGVVEITLSSFVRETLVTEVLTVNVLNNHVSIEAQDETTFVRSDVGYNLDLSCVDYTGCKNFIKLGFDVYVDGKISSTPLAFEVISGVDCLAIQPFSTDYYVRGKAFGQSIIRATFDDVGNHAEFLINVNVYRPSVKLASTFDVEVNRLSPLDLSAESITDINAEVFLNGEKVGTYSKKKITLLKAKLPTTASKLGAVSLTFSQEKFDYSLDINLYSLIISTKDDLNRMVEIAKANDPTEYLADGYFVLGADIEYNGTFTSMFSAKDLKSISLIAASWFDGTVTGFKGIFDGQGHFINGLAIRPLSDASDVYCTSIFGVLHTGSIIRNVAFTNAIVDSETAYIANAGDGLIQNVFVGYKSIGFNSAYRHASTYEAVSTRYYSGTVYTSLETGAIGKNAELDDVVIDASNATIYQDVVKNISVAAAAGSDVKDDSLTFAPSSVDVNDISSSFFSTSYNLGMQVPAISAYVNLLDEDIWHHDDYVLNFKSVVNDASKALTISAEQEVAHAGDVIEINTNLSNDIVNLAVDDKDYAYFVGNELVITEENKLSKDLTVTATSKLDSTNKTSITISYVQTQELGDAGMVDLDERLNSGSLAYGASSYTFDLSAIVISGLDTLQGVVINDKFTPSGAKVSYNNATKELTISDPKILGTVYGNEMIYVRFNDIDYAVSVLFITKTLRNANDINSFFAIGKQLEPSNVHLYGGHFVLGNNIDYDAYDPESGTGNRFYSGTDSAPQNGIGALFHYANGRDIPLYKGDGTDGFKGVIDGNGYAIKDFFIPLNWYFGGFISCMHAEGVLRNIAFQNIQLGWTSKPIEWPYGYVSIVAGGSGLVENVYVTRKWINLARPRDGIFYNYNDIFNASMPTMKNLVVNDTNHNDTVFTKFEGRCCSGFGMSPRTTMINVGVATTNEDIIDTLTYNNTETGLGKSKHLDNSKLFTNGDIQAIYTHFGSEFISTWKSLWKSGSGVVIPA